MCECADNAGQLMQLLNTTFNNALKAEALQLQHASISLY